MAEIIAKIVEAAADAVKEVVSAAVRKGAELPKAKGADVSSRVDLNQLKTPGVTKADCYEDFSYARLPFIINQQRKEEQEESEEQETGRGDLLQLELKSHLAQLKTPGLSLKKQKKEYGKRLQSQKQTQNLSAQIYDLIRSILHIFPWFYNFIKGVIILRSTKQS